jgi:hypothetical protein
LRNFPLVNGTSEEDDGDEEDLNEVSVLVVGEDCAHSDVLLLLLLSKDVTDRVTAVADRRTLPLRTNGLEAARRAMEIEEDIIVAAQFLPSDNCLSSLI